MTEAPLSRSHTIVQQKLEAHGAAENQQQHIFIMLPVLHASQQSFGWCGLCIQAANVPHATGKLFFLSKT